MIFKQQEMGCVIYFKQTTNNCFWRKKEVIFSRKNPNLQHSLYEFLPCFSPTVYFNFSETYFWGTLTDS